MTTPTPAPAPVAPNPSLFETLISVLQTEPALVTNLLGAAAVLIGAFVSTVTQSQEAAIVTIATALITVLTASLAKPVKVSLIAGAVVTGLTAAVAFGLKVPAEDLAIISTAITSVLTLILRAHLTPNVSLPR